MVGGQQEQVRSRRLPARYFTEVSDEHTHPFAGFCPTKADLFYCIDDQRVFRASSAQGHREIDTSDKQAVYLLYCGNFFDSLQRLDVLNLNHNRSLVSALLKMRSH